MTKKTRRLVVALSALAVLCLACVSCGVEKATVRSRSRRFEALCTSVHVGDTSSAVRRRFLAAGQSLSGWGTERSGAISSLDFFRREEPFWWRLCQVRLDVTTGRATSVRAESGTDFSECADRGAYPHRYWLCAAVDALLR